MERQRQIILGGERTERFHIERDKSEKLNKDGSFVGWDPEDEYNADQTLYYDFSGDHYTMEFIFPQEFLIDNENNQRLENAEIEISLTKKALTEIENFRKEATKQFTTGIKTIVVVSIIEVIGTILLCILFALQKKRTRFFRGLDRIWWEIILAAAIILIRLAIALCLAIWQYTVQYAQGGMSGSTMEMIMMLSYLSVPFFVMVFAVCTQTTIWRLREKNLLDSTFSLGYIRKWIRNAKARRKLEDEAMSFSEVHAREQRDLSKLVDQIERISNGELTATTDIKEESVNYEYSKKLTNIAQGMEKALETQMKGERMKIDLITNVSHDLKTPLTSIIGYVDLLSKDKTLSGEAKDYVTILIKKTERLKDIIQDLFELAKSTSGDVKADMEEMDMKRLVEQTLGDMSDQIEESGFGIRYQCNAAHTKFIGDGNRMYRVVQNVIENALKYSLKGTRIFINIMEQGSKVVLRITNTASYEMNFTEEEIMERFARAEKSRTSEGNGLGLSIADSFTKNCGGRFDIKIDGDQFIVTIQFEQYFKENQ